VPPPVPPGPVEIEAPHRTIAIVVDDLGLSIESMNQVRQQLRKFIAEQTQPSDLVAIIRTGGEIGAATPPGRRFLLNSDLYSAFFIYNASPNLVLQTKLFRDGKVVKTVADAPLDVANKDVLGRNLITNVMRLTPDLEPGDYYLQVVIIDKAAKDKQSAVTQRVDFEVVR
jgi:hypothetical protein